MDFNIVKVVQQPLFDYGKIYSGIASYNVVEPNSIEQGMAIIKWAAQKKVPLRVRASGHAFSGASLPREGELLIRTNRLDQFRFEAQGSITVEAGSLVWDVRDFLRSYGYDLPVWNGGWAGPTIGGYINAGGIGAGGPWGKYGGLWENVNSVTLIDGTGELRTLHREDAIFPWVFGSYGQFGLLVEVNLRIIPFEDKKAIYPMRLSGRIPRCQSDDPAENDLPPKGGKQSSLFWFDLLVSEKQLIAAYVALHKFVNHFAGEVIPHAGWAGLWINGEPIAYHFFIPFLTFNPPLLYPIAESFCVIGVMCYLEAGDEETNRRILILDKEFVGMAMKNSYKMYRQAGNIGHSVSCDVYYGEKIYSDFLALKQEMDPNMLFNRGVVFPD